MRSSYKVLLKLNYVWGDSGQNLDGIYHYKTYFTKRQILCSTRKGQALTVKVESVPELDTGQDSCQACVIMRNGHKTECITP